MEALSKFKVEILLTTYWAANAVNTVFVSRAPGYYPPSALEHAKALAKLRPYPWADIFIVWSILAIATLFVYFIVKKSKFKFVGVMAFSLAMALVDSFVTPSDVGGVHYAIIQYAVYLFLITIVLAVASFCVARFRRVS